MRRPLRATLFPYTTLFRSTRAVGKALAMDMILTGRMLSAREALDFGLVARVVAREAWLDEAKRVAHEIAAKRDRKSTRLNSSHPSISYAVFCLKKKNHGGR